MIYIQKCKKNYQITQNHIQGLPNLKNIGTIVITTGYGMTDY